MNRSEQQVVQAAVELRELMVGGGLPKRGLGKPPYAEGERLLARLFHATSRRVPLAADRESIEQDGLPDGRGKLRTEGALYTTDRGAYLMGNVGKVVASWSWHELSSVSVIRGYFGVRLVRPTDTEASDAVLNVHLPYVLLQASDFDIAKQVVQVEAAYVLGTGRDYDAWLVRLQQRFV